MKLTGGLFAAPEPKSEKESFKGLQSLWKACGKLYADLNRLLSGNLGFGDGATADNIKGAWLTFTSNATPNTEETLAHGLGAVPIGYLVFSRNKAAVLYNGTTAWTTTNLYVKSDTASTTFLIFVFITSQQ